MLNTEHFLIRAYDPSYNSSDRDAIQMIAEEAWPENPKIYSNEGFILEDSGTASTKTTIIGFIMYQYLKPETLTIDDHDWWHLDFKKHLNSWMHSIKTSLSDNHNVNKHENNNRDHDHNTEDEHLRCMQLNPHLQDISNWNRLQSHIIHITDIALISTFRGRGIGTYLLQTFIFSFPRGTRFGLEVVANNHSAINCYQKCGFIIERNVIDYYGARKAGLKMTLISSYNDDDITQFILASNHKTHNHKNGIKKKHQRIAKYTVRFANESAFDTQGIKRILYTTWPNHQRFEPQPLTMVVEETFHRQPQIVAFVQCTLRLLTECAICDSVNHGRTVPKVPHTHHRWYIGVDFDARLIRNRTIPNRNTYKELLATYNPFLNAQKEEWSKLNNHFVHIRSFGVDKDHRHKGLGSLMMNNLMHCFPFSTMFGLEVEANNHNAIRLYTKCGFGVKRIVNDYYGRERDAYKMIMISPYNMKQSLQYLKQHQSIMKPQNAMNHCVEQINKKKHEAKENQILYRKETDLCMEYGDECVGNIRAMDTYLDGMSVERLLKDKRSWQHWPFMDSKHGFVVERVMEEDANETRCVIGYIGYQTIQNIDMIHVKSGRDGIGWTDSDFPRGSTSSTDMIYISQFCVDYRYQQFGIGATLLAYCIQSFPNHTRFGADIESTNECAMKLFIKTGFVIRRTVSDFYDFGRNASKLTFISDVNDGSPLNMYLNELKGLQNTFKFLLKQKEDAIERQNACESQKRIQKALEDLCSDDWRSYLENFEKHEVFDSDVYELSEEDLKCLIPKMGPRSRFRKWIKELKGIKQ